jgi:hypothetical protein
VYRTSAAASAVVEAIVLDSVAVLYVASSTI